MKYCTVCGKVSSKEYGEYGPHQYDEANNVVVKETTCTEDGIVSITCSICGESIEITMHATGHKDVDGDGLCDECGASMTQNNSTDGSTTGTCDKCGRNHLGESGGLYGYNGFICRLIAFIRMIVKVFGK